MFHPTNTAAWTRRRLGGAPAGHARGVPSRAGVLGAVVMAVASLALVGDARAESVSDAECDTTAGTALRSPYLGSEAESALESGGQLESIPEGRFGKPTDTPFTYILHVPDGLPAGPVPLLVGMHGLGGSGWQFASLSEWALTAAEEEMIVAFPTGHRKWDASSGSIDVAFIRDVVAEIRSERCIDGRRIWAIGQSYGALMSQRLACDAPDLFAAVAMHAAADIATPAGGPCPVVAVEDGGTPVPVAFWHGSDDELLDYERHGRAAWSGWLERYGCETITIDETRRFGPREIASDCSIGGEDAPGGSRPNTGSRGRSDRARRAGFFIQFATDYGHLHAYPDGCGGAGRASCDPDGTWPTARTQNREALDFFRAHPRAEPAAEAPMTPVPVPAGSDPADLVPFIVDFLTSRQPPSQLEG